MASDEMNESGIAMDFDLDDLAIDIDIDSLIMNDLMVSPVDPIQYYQLKSKPVSLAESPSFKTEPVKSRTVLKQQLQKDRLLKEKEKLHVPKEPEKNEKHTNTKVPINLPNALPPYVLQVTTGLANPTKYHIKEKQKHQVLQFLSTSQKDDSGFALQEKAAGSSAHSANKIYSYNSPQPTPSPGVVSITSGGTSDAEDIMESILSYEESASETDFTRQSLYGSQTSLETNRNTSSYPQTKVKQEDHSPYGEDVVRERVKKDTHNMIERRRRYNINDRITELGDLLPKRNEPHYDVVRDSRANKGTILKASVDYIKVLKEENSKIKQMEEKVRNLLTFNRKLQLKIQELEIAAQKNGVALKEKMWHPAEPSVIIDRFIRPAPSLTRGHMPDLVSEAACAYDESMDDVVLPDPVLASSANVTFPERRMDIN